MTLGKRFWDPDNKINNDLFQALEEALFGAHLAVPAGTTINDAVLISSRVTYVETTVADAGLILPDALGVFMIVNKDPTNNFWLYPNDPSSIIYTSGFCDTCPSAPGDPVQIGTGGTTGVTVVRVGKDWAVVGAG